MSLKKMKVEPVQPVQLNIYQSNTYRKKKAGYILTMSQGFKKERSSEGQAVLDIHLCSLSNNSK